MAERLTKKIGNDLYIGKHCDDCPESIEYCGECSYVQSIKNQLGKLEDILEKYDLEVEELDERIYNGAFNYIDKLKAENDRDTWKKACELACDDLGLYEDVTTTQLKMKCYYQQAKKGNDSH